MFTHPELLRIPGPTPIPPRVQQAMNRTMFGHRGNDMKQLLQNIRHSLKDVFGTKEEIVILSSSGTSALEAAVVNTVREGDDVLVIVGGAFGERFANICETYNLNVHRLNVTWGEAVNPEDIRQFLQKHPQTKAVFATYCETSTGVLHPIAEISKVVHETSDALIIVDGVSAVGGAVTKMDEWEVDVFVTGSQKAFMLPAGLSFIALSERAEQRAKENKQPRFYLDVLKHQTYLADNSTPFTPSMSVLMGLEEVLNMFSEEGLDNVYARHELMKEMTRAALKALNVPLLVADEFASPTVTSAIIEEDEADQLRAILNEEFGLTFAGGQQHLKGKIIRIGHMGYCSPAHVLQMISLLEIGLQRLGKDISIGEGVKAAQHVYITGGN
ncbi:MAG TPA: alanine--glyoxylate aminotransferase family protein [Bacillota bacterium]|nr:alanine--glyoxylate aminotransferase family protein [Bacillota bacterium]